MASFRPFPETGRPPNHRPVGRTPWISPRGYHVDQLFAPPCVGVRPVFSRPLLPSAPSDHLSRLLSTAHAHNWPTRCIFLVLPCFSRSLVWPTLCVCLYSVQMKGLAAVVFLLCLASAHKSGDVKHKWWSIPEPVATVGKLFYFKIPHDSVVDNTGPIDVSLFYLAIKYIDSTRTMRQ